MNQIVRIALYRALSAVSLIFLSTFSMALAAGTWTQNSRMTEGGILLQAASDGSNIYVAGGSSITGPKASFDLYDTVNDQWRPLPPMPTARERFGMAAFSGRIYVSGGRARDVDEDTLSTSAALWIFDTVSSDWILKADMPTPRVDHVMVNCEDKLYVLGGTGEFSNRIYIYDPAEDKWTTAGATMKTPRKNFGVARDGTSIYLIGGITPGGKLLDDVDVFDTVSQTWTSRASLPKPRAGLAAAVIDGRLHVAGGSTPDPAQTFNEHLSLGAGENAWRTEPELPTARHSMAYALAGNKWYVMGGGSAAGFYTLFSAADAVESYDIN